MAKLIPIASVAQPADGPMDLPRFPMLPKAGYGAARPPGHQDIGTYKA